MLDVVTEAEVVVVLVVVEVLVWVAVEVDVTVAVVLLPPEQEERTNAAKIKQLNPRYRMFFFTY